VWRLRNLELGKRRQTRRTPKASPAPNELVDYKGFLFAQSSLNLTMPKPVIYPASYFNTEINITKISESQRAVGSKTSQFV
jgi:hypothetical protein